MDIKTFDLGYCKETEYTRVVCVAKYQNKYVFSYNKKRKGWEIPGGHIEPGETWQEAVSREMYEETGATKINIKPICIYKINTFGLLCYCEILELSDIPEYSEMEKITLTNTLPKNLTFPENHKLFFEIIKEKLK